MFTDSWGDIRELVHFQSAGAATLPVLDATQGWRTAIAFTVPVGKEFIPLWASVNSDGVLQSLVRVSRRDHLWAFAGAAIVDPTVPADPTIVALASSGMEIGSRSYKFTLLNNVGETLPTAATGAVANTLATDGYTVPLVAAGTGTTYRRIYRTAAGQGVTGPWYLLHEVDDAVGGYTDTHPDGDLNQSVQPPAANTTAGSALGRDATPVAPISEVVVHVTRVALAAATIRLIYIDEDGLQESTTVTPTVTVNTMTAAPLKRQAIGLTGVLDQLGRTNVTTWRGGDVNHGLARLVSVTGFGATGQANIYGYQPILRGPGSMVSAAVTGGNDRQTTTRNKEIAVAERQEVVVEVVHPAGTTAASQNYIVDMVGRLRTKP